MKADHKTEAEVMAVMRKLNEAYERRDMNLLLSLATPDADLVMYGTGADEKRFGLDGLRAQAERDWSQTDAASLQILWYAVSSAGPVAWVACDAEFHLQAGGQQLKFPARLTSVLEKRGDQWLIAQAHFSFPAAEQAEGESFPQ